MRLFEFLFERSKPGPLPADDPLLDEGVQRAVEIMDPRLGLVPHYAEQLRPAVSRAIDYLRSAVSLLSDVHEADAAVWSADPVIRAVFPRPADVAEIVSRSPEVQQFFSADLAAPELVGVLAMVFSEKHVVEPALQGGSVPQEVLLRRLSFGDHRVALAARDRDALFPMIGRAIFHDLLVLAAERFSAQEQQVLKMGIAHSLLQARLRVLRARERTLVTAFEEGATADPAAEIGRIEERLARIGTAIRDLTGGGNTLERELYTVRDVLMHADEVVNAARYVMRVDTLNTIVDKQLPQSGTLIEFGVFRVPGDPLRTRAAILIRFARSGLRRGGLAVDEVGRTL